MENLQRQHPQVELIDYEVWNHPENKARLLTIANAYGTKVVDVPATFIGDRVWVGFAERYKGEMDDKVRSCIKFGCPDPGQRLLAAKTGEIGPSEETPLTAPPPEEGHPIDREAASAAQDTITIPHTEGSGLESRTPRGQVLNRATKGLNHVLFETGNFRQ